MSLASIISSDIDVMFADWEDYYTQGGTTVLGIFENEYRTIDLLTGEVSSAKPAFVRKATGPPALPGETIIVTADLYSASQALYIITNIENAPADLGPGLMRLLLKKA